MFYVSIINEFNEKISELENTQVSQLKKANAGIHIAAWALDTFKEYVTKKGFDTLQDEISFFN